MSIYGCMQKKNPGKKNQTRFKPGSQPIINTKHAYHWLNVRFKPSLILFPLGFLFWMQSSNIFFQ